MVGGAVELVRSTPVVGVGELAHGVVAGAVELVRSIDDLRELAHGVVGGAVELVRSTPVVGVGELAHGVVGGAWSSTDVSVVSEGMVAASIEAMQSVV